jgi:hypothetical protein
MRAQLYRAGGAVKSLAFRLTRPNLVNQYASSAPNPQNALDIFRGEWASRMPAPLAEFEAGSVPLFDDARIRSAIEVLGGVEGKRVVELGPLEAGHTFMLVESGAASVTAVEASTRAYLKCLVVKELLDLQRARFLFGDFVEYLRSSQEQFDFCMASGVLYHMRNPVELLELISRSARELYLWTHYYDQALVAQRPRVAGHFAGSEVREHAGFRHTLHRHEYRTGIFTNRFFGGPAAHSQWMLKEDIVRALEHFEMEVIWLETQPDHPHGPSLSLVAVRR